MRSQKSRRKPALPPVLVDELRQAQRSVRDLSATMKRELLGRRDESLREYIARVGISPPAPPRLSLQELHTIERASRALDELHAHIVPAQPPGRPSDDSLRRDVAEFLRERGYANAPRSEKTRIRRLAWEKFGASDSTMTKAWAEFGPKP